MTLFLHCKKYVTCRDDFAMRDPMRKLIHEKNLGMDMHEILAFTTNRTDGM